MNKTGREPATHCNINLVKLKSSKDIFDSSKCKVTFGFKYIYAKKKFAKAYQVNFKLYSSYIVTITERAPCQSDPKRFIFKKKQGEALFRY